MNIIHVSKESNENCDFFEFEENSVKVGNEKKMSLEDDTSRRRERLETNNTNSRDKNGLEFGLIWLTGKSSNRYAFRDEKKANLHGNFKRHGKGEYDSLSSRSHRFKVKGSIDRYGRRAFQHSKIQRGGKRKSYSKRFSYDYFDINGGVSSRRKTMGLGTDTESGHHIEIKLSSDIDNNHQNSDGRRDSNFDRRRLTDDRETRTTHNSSSLQLGNPIK
ncbi:unnamed protein product [Schistosoma turkestanicum]|nr:unnamed protein product [Schistosoma turkestanicum]